MARGRVPRLGLQESHVIERLSLPVSEADVGSLADLLVDAVESGAAVSFMALTRGKPKTGGGGYSRRPLPARSIS